MPADLLFVYGTLRDADVLALVLGRAVDPATRLAAIAPGHAVVFFPGRTYPAIRAAPGHSAHGLALAGLTAADLATLDAFEGEEYRRGPIDLIVTGATRRADVYWPQVPIGTAEPEWRLEDWTEQHKPAFLAAEALDLAGWRARLSGLER